MDAGAAFLAFLGGSAVGAIGTAIYTTSHERAERFRERMLDAAETFLKAEEACEDAIGHARDLRRRLSEAADRLLAALDEIEAPEETSEEEEFVKFLEESGELTRALSDYADHVDEDSAARLASAEQRLASLQETAAEYEEPQREQVLAYIGRLVEYGAAARQVVDAGIAVQGSLGRIANLTARIRILFAHGERDDPVTRDAFAVARALRAWARLAWMESSIDVSPAAVVRESPDAADGEASPREAEGEQAQGEQAQVEQAEGEQADGVPTEQESDNAPAAAQRAFEEVGKFAAHVSARVQKRWL